MHTIDISTAIIVAGTAVRQYFPQPIIYPFFAATDVPTTFADISEFEAICEIEEKKAGYNPELSYGSHIFQDLVEAEILYTAVFANEKTLRFAPEKLAEYPDIVSLFTEDPELKQVVHVYDMSKVSCELCNDLQNERLVLYQQ